MRIITLFSLLSLFTTSLYSQQGKLFLTILDRETNLNIPHVQVIIQKGTENSQILDSDNGLIDIKLAYGEYTITVEHADYIFEKQSIKIESNLQYYKILSKQPVQIPDVQITSLGIPKKLSTIITPVEILKSNEIMAQSSLTPADALAQVPGVYVARDGAWASSINLRGLSEQRIVTLVDGFRIETASELAGGFGMIDLNNVTRIEVVKGSVSDLQGTGAVGGLINYVTHEGYYSDSIYSGGKFAYQYQTTNGLKGLHLNLNTGGKEWWFTASGSLRNAADMRTPDGKLPNSSFEDHAVNLKAAFKISPNQELKLIFQDFRATDAGITGGSSFSQTSVASYKNANRDLIGFNYAIQNPNTSSVWKRANLSGFYQYIQRDVEVIASPTITLEPTGKHTTLGLKSNSEWQLSDNLNLEAGAEIWQREMTSFRKKTVITPPNTPLAEPTTTIWGELPLPHAWYTSTGSYLLTSYNPWSFIKLSLSARADLIHIRNDEAITPQYQTINDVTNYNPDNQRIIFAAGNQNNHSFSFQSGAGIQLNKWNKINLTISKSFRSPSLEERFKYIDLGKTVTYGNPALEPENGWFYNVGYELNTPYFNFIIDGFVNSIHNYITSVPGTFSYTTPSNTKDTLHIDALVAANLNHAILTGGEVSTIIRTQTPLWFSVSASYVRGIEKLSDTNLPLMPPLNGQAGIHYFFEKMCTLTAQIKLADKQTKVADKETTTGGYALYNISVESIEYNLYYFRLKCFAGVENLTDQAWRNHLATNRGLVRLESGRNAFIKLQMNW